MYGRHARSASLNRRSVLSQIDQIGGSFKLSKTAQAFQGYLETYELTTKEETFDLSEFLDKVQETLKKILDILIKDRNGLKIWLELDILYDDLSKEKEVLGHLSVDAQYIINDFEFDEFFQNVSKEIKLSNETLLGKNQGCGLSRLEKCF